MARSTFLEKLVTDALDLRVTQNETDFATISADGAIANTNLADMPADTIKGRLGTTGAPTDLTPLEIRQLLIDDTGNANSDLWSAAKIVNEIGAATSAALTYIGGYDAVAAPDLSTSEQGNFYTVTVAGTFFGEPVEVGDSLIAQTNNPSVLADWTIVNKNIDIATETTPGIVELAADGESGAGLAVQGNDSRLVDQNASEVPFDNTNTDFVDATDLQGLGESISQRFLDLEDEILVKVPRSINTVDPTIGDTNYTLGHEWENTSTNEVFKLVEFNTGSAIWFNLKDIEDGSYNNSASGLVADSYQGAIDELALSAKTNIAIARQENPPASITFTPEDETIQHFVLSAQTTIALSGTPATGRHFIIKNSLASTANVVISASGLNILPGEIYEIVFDGTEWVEL